MGLLTLTTAPLRSSDPEIRPTFVLTQDNGMNETHTSTTRFTAGKELASSTLLIVLWLASVSVTLGAQEGAGVEPKTPYRIPKTDAPIVVDGVLDETAWQIAWTMELRYEVVPGENVPPPVRNEVLVTYDDERLYIAFRAWDPKPSAIRAHLTDRDGTMDDDTVGVILDTFNDERSNNCYLCQAIKIAGFAGVTAGQNIEIPGRYSSSSIRTTIWATRTSSSPSGIVQFSPRSAMPGHSDRRALSACDQTDHPQEGEHEQCKKFSIPFHLSPGYSRRRHHHRELGGRGGCSPLFPTDSQQDHPRDAGARSAAPMPDGAGNPRYDFNA